MASSSSRLSVLAVSAPFGSFDEGRVGEALAKAAEAPGDNKGESIADSPHAPLTQATT